MKSSKFLELRLQSGAKYIFSKELTGTGKAGEVKVKQTPTSVLLPVDIAPSYSRDVGSSHNASAQSPSASLALCTQVQALCFVPWSCSRIHSTGAMTPQTEETLSFFKAQTAKYLFSNKSFKYGIFSLFRNPTAFLCSVSVTGAVEHPRAPCASGVARSGTRGNCSTRVGAAVLHTTFAIQTRFLHYISS